MASPVVGRKTQLYPLVLKDHIHKRLTHSIEVGGVGRTLGISVGEFLVSKWLEWISY